MELTPLQDNDVEGINKLGNYEAETVILGNLLNNNKLIKKIHFLKAYHFFYRPHDLVFEQILDFIDKGIEATSVSIKNFMYNKDEYFFRQDPAYLAKLASNAMRLIDITSYGKIIYELSTLRAIKAEAEDIISQVDNSMDFQSEKILASAEENFNKIRKESYSTEQLFFTMKEAGDMAMEEIDKAQMSPDKIIGLDTGYPKLNEFISGLTNSELIILAARPSMGKTAFALNLAINSSLTMKEGKVLFVSIEMSKVQLAHRAIACMSNITSTELKSGNLTSAKYNLAGKTVEDFVDKNIVFVDLGKITLSKLKYIIQRSVKLYNCKLVIIDYLQILEADEGMKKLGKVAEVTEISRSLKSYAKKFEVPIIALSQLSRSLAQREDKTPQLSDLRDSGSIEQDADIVCFLHREEYYTNRQRSNFLKQNREDLEKIKGVAELIVSKNRNGPIGIVKFNFNKEVGRFAEM